MQTASVYRTRRLPGYWLWIRRDREKFQMQAEGNTWDMVNLELAEDGEHLGSAGDGGAGDGGWHYMNQFDGWW